MNLTIADVMEKVERIRASPQSTETEQMLLVLADDLLNTSKLDAAVERLGWLRDEYGKDDIDYLTFVPVIARMVLIEGMLAATIVQRDKFAIIADERLAALKGKEILETEAVPGVGE